MMQILFSFHLVPPPDPRLRRLGPLLHPVNTAYEEKGSMRLKIYGPEDNGFPYYFEGKSLVIINVRCMYVH